MADWKSYKGEGPWAFVKGPNKYSYNEGRLIGVHTNPIWPVPDGSIGSPITPTHNPCGYWHDRPYNPYVPPTIEHTWGYPCNLEYGMGSWNSGGIISSGYPTSVYVGNYIENPTHVWMWFNSLSIPPGSIILDAWITFYAGQTAQAGDCSFLCGFGNVDDATIPTSEGEAGALSIISPVVLNLPIYPRYTEIVVHITDSVQATINRPLWTFYSSGIVLIKESGSDGSAYRSIEGPTATPVLRIQFLSY